MRPENILRRGCGPLTVEDNQPSFTLVFKSLKMIKGGLTTGMRVNVGYAGFM